jgi:hypothetical protein
MVKVERPPSFEEEWQNDWSLYVIEHGLPDLPPTVRVGESVPVARWVGPRRAAVLHVEWSWSDDHLDDELVDNTEMFYMTSSGWEPFGGMGGSGWFDPPLVRPGMHQRAAYIGGGSAASEEGVSCETCIGWAGEDATTIELEDADGVLTRPLESPLGVFVVASAGEAAAFVRVLDAQGRVLTEDSFGGRL